MIQIKRAYDPPGDNDGRRILVERLWPRGIKKEDLKLDDWCKDVAPTTELRKWFQHDPEKWSEFRKRYFKELDEHPDAWKSLVTVAHKHRITLLFSSHDAEHNNVVALKQYLDSKS